MTPSGSTPPTAVRTLGTLEKQVMDVLWDAAEPRTARQVLDALTGQQLAYTTVATVLTNLAKKGLAERLDGGRSLVYTPTLSRSRYTAHLMTQVLHSNDDHEESFLHFVETISDADAELLRHLLDDPGRGRRG